MSKPSDRAFEVICVLLASALMSMMFAWGLAMGRADGLKATRATVPVEVTVKYNAPKPASEILFEDRSKSKLRGYLPPAKEKVK